MQHILNIPPISSYHCYISPFTVRTFSYNGLMICISALRMLVNRTFTSGPLSRASLIYRCFWTGSRLNHQADPHSMVLPFTVEQVVTMWAMTLTNQFSLESTCHSRLATQVLYYSACITKSQLETLVISNCSFCTLCMIVVINDKNNNRSNYSLTSKLENSVGE